PHVAKAIVLASAVMAGAYTTAWARRWLGAPAGWAGAFLAFVPAMIVWSNTVMLNVPATALGLGLFFHFRRWQESGGSAQLILAAVCLSAVALTYYPGAAAVCVCVAWTLRLRGDVHLDRKVLV